MKICMVVSRVPWPLEKGDKLRAYHQLRYLASKHELHLFCLSDAAVNSEALANLQLITPHVTVYKLNRLKMVVRLCLALFSRKPFQVHYFFDRSIARRLRRAVDDLAPDVVYCQLIRCSEYVKHWHHYHKVLDYMDALSAGQQRRAKRAPWYLAPFVREESRRLAAYEHLIVDYFERHCIISEQDRGLIYHPHNSRIQIIPNGIDSDYFSQRGSRSVRYDVLFTGNMSYPPNVEGAQRLVLEIMPLVRSRRPNTSVLLAGANPTSSVLALASDTVTVSGWIEDMRTAYNQSGVFVAPMLSGSGMQNKLLEAMCMELPCVTTSLAATPIGAVHGEHWLIGDSNEELAEAILKLLDDAEVSAGLGVAARAFVLERFNWEKTVELLVETCFNANDLKS
jgi:sugar transferase (PEP-CTERM/EpsH1 system associated)